MTKQIYSFFYIHDTEARAFSWTISTFVACHCWLAESPLVEPVNSIGCHQLRKPTRTIPISGWLKENIPFVHKSYKMHWPLSVTTADTKRFIFVPHLSQLQPTRCACPEMFSAQVIVPSFVL